MKLNIKSSKELGHVVRAVRKDAGVRIDDLAGIVGANKQTTANLELGVPSVGIGFVLKHLSELGITLTLDIPESALKRLLKLSESSPELTAQIEQELWRARVVPGLVSSLPGSANPGMRALEAALGKNKPFSAFNSSVIPDAHATARDVLELVQKAENSRSPVAGHEGSKNKLKNDKGSDQ